MDARFQLVMDRVPDPIWLTIGRDPKIETLLFKPDKLLGDEGHRQTRPGMDDHAHAAVRTRGFIFLQHENPLSDLGRRRQCRLEHPTSTGLQRVLLKVALRAAAPSLRRNSGSAANRCNAPTRASTSLGGTMVATSSAPNISRTPGRSETITGRPADIYSSSLSGEVIDALSVSLAFITCSQ